MAKLTKDERDKLPAEDFADPKNRLFPITDQDSVHSAATLFGKAEDPEKVKENIKKIAKRKGHAVPEEWMEEDKKAGGKCSYEDDGGGDAEGGDEGGDGDGDADMSADFTIIFDDSSADAAGFILRKAPILFRAGDYPDKSFSMTPEELLAAVRDFAPVHIDLEHKPSVLDKKLGQIVSVGLSSDGWVMTGEANIPVWLDKVLGKDERKLSAAFDRKTKKMIGCSLVRNPRVSDATLMAAFAASGLPMDGSVVKQVPGGPQAGSEADPDGTPTPEQKAAEVPASSMGAWRSMMPKAAYEAVGDKDKTAEGQKALKAAHDATADAGACGGDDEKADYTVSKNLTEAENDFFRVRFHARKEARRRFLEATFASDPEAEKLRAIHDMSSNGGCHCVSYESGDKVSKESGGTYDKQRDDEDINDSDKLNKPAPTATDSPAPLNPPEATKPVDNGKMASTSEIAQGGVKRGNSPYEGFSADDVPPQLKAQMDAMQAQLKKLRDEKVAAEAVNFADGEIAAKRSLPADRDGLIAAYTLAANDDLSNAHPVVFDNMSLSRVEFLKRSHLKRLSHNLTSELVATQAGNQVAFNHQTTPVAPAGSAPLSEERRKELLAHTALGRTVLTTKN